MGEYRELFEFAAKAGLRICPDKDALFVFRMTKVDKDMPIYKMDVIKFIG